MCAKNACRQQILLSRVLSVRLLFLCSQRSFLLSISCMRVLTTLFFGITEEKQKLVSSVSQFMSVLLGNRKQLIAKLAQPLGSHAVPVETEQQQYANVAAAVIV